MEFTKIELLRYKLTNEVVFLVLNLLAVVACVVSAIINFSWYWPIIGSINLLFAWDRYRSVQQTSFAILKEKSK